jgi:hypothetical protein
MMVAGYDFHHDVLDATIILHASAALTRHFPKIGCLSCTKAFSEML